MKLVLNKSSYLKSSIDAISGLIIEARFSLNKSGIELKSNDPANICMVIFKLNSLGFVTYELENNIELGLKISDLKDILRKTSENDVLTIEYEEPRLVLTLKGKTIKTFKINTLEIEDKGYKEPELKFDCEIRTTSSIFKEAIDTCDITRDDEGIEISANSDKLTFYTESAGNNEAKVVIKPSKETELKTDKEVKAKYSKEYLKKIMEGCKISEDVRIHIKDDFPLRVDFIVPDKVQLAFILAPRVTNE